MQDYTFKNLKINFPSQFVIHVELNRPTKLNAFDRISWRELHACFKQIAIDPDVRVVVISGAGKLFNAGIDLNNLREINDIEEKDFARPVFVIFMVIKVAQDSISSIELCDKPVIAAIHNGCIGAGVDLITACDIRYCSQDAFFSVKAIDLGLAADIGTLQRLPKVVGNNSLIRELCLTGRKYASEALNIGLVNKVLKTKEETLTEALKTASIIASKSPIATLSTKHLLNFSRDHSVTEGLAYTAAWNGAMLNSNVGGKKSTFFL
ncbi:ClpP/crotonase-like domain-containing protein [Glomus cerebriforme]|uniref:ClpP/crotonase-like domain-containing protein n=1 Tax=Glomus cerebriforme TaxID=658196 RepID=A0A397SEN4_9GLOM|nr:ClpP/crotonase-like domain-containing protein [Glomus cerebriforme]